MNEDRIYQAISDAEERRRQDHAEVMARLDAINGRVRGNEIQIAHMKGKASTAGVISGVVSGVVAGLAAAFGIHQ